MSILYLGKRSGDLETIHGTQDGFACNLAQVKHSITLSILYSVPISILIIPPLFTCFCIYQLLACSLTCITCMILALLLQSLLPWSLPCLLTWLLISLLPFLPASYSSLHSFFYSNSHFILSLTIQAQCCPVYAQLEGVRY